MKPEQPAAVFLPPLRQEDPHTGQERYGTDPFPPVLPEMQV